MPGLSATPVRQPARRSPATRSAVRRRLDVDGDRVRARLGERLDWRSGRSIIRCTSISAPAAWTWSAIASTTSGPIVIGGTKWPSITSTWITVRAGVEHGRDLLGEAAEVGGEDRRGDALEHQIGRRASTTGSARRCTARCSTCARSSSARRSSGTPSAARSGAGSSRSGSGPGRLVGRSHGSWQDGQTSTRGRRRLMRASSLAMKKPSVRSRCGSVCRVLRHGRMLPDGRVGCPGRRARSPRERPRKPATTLLVLDGRDRAGRVDEGTAGPYSAAAPASRISRLELGQRLRAAGLAPARVGARGERAEVAARRVDEHAVERLVGARLRRRRRCARRRSSRPSARRSARSASARPAWRSTATISPCVAHQRGEVGGLAAGRGAQVEHALARLRARAHARPPSPRATAASAGPRAHSGAGEGVERARRGSAPRRRRRGAGIRSASACAVVLERVGAQRGLGGLVVGRHQRAGGLGAERRRTTARRSTRGGECCSAACAGVASGSADDRGRASRAARRRTALTRPAPRGRVALGQLDRLADRRVRGHAVEKGQLEDPEPQRGAAPAGRASPALGARGARSRGRAWPRAGRCRS